MDDPANAGGFVWGTGRAKSHRPAGWASDGSGTAELNGASEVPPLRVDMDIVRKWVSFTARREEPLGGGPDG